MNFSGVLEEFGWSFDSTFQSQLAHIHIKFLQWFHDNDSALELNKMSPATLAAFGLGWYVSDSMTKDEKQKWQKLILEAWGVGEKAAQKGQLRHECAGRGGENRTPDFLLPKQAPYRWATPRLQIQSYHAWPRVKGQMCRIFG